jgi:hypothetical protein
MKIYALVLILLSSFSINAYELNELYYFPSKGGSSLSLDTSLKSYEVEYGDDDVGVAGGDIQEYDQSAVLFEPFYKYSLSDSFLLSASFKYQTDNTDVSIEDIDDNATPVKSKGGIHDPTIGFRYRPVKKETVFVDLLLNQSFKTNAYVEGNRQRSSQAYSGHNKTRLATVMGFKYRKFMLQTHLHVDLLTDLERMIVILEESYKADSTFAVGFGGKVLFRATELLNITAGFNSASINAYDMKGATTKLHIDQVLSALFTTSFEYKRFEKSFGILSLGFAVDTTFNRFTYEDTNVLESESQSILSTLRIEKRF